MTSTTTTGPTALRRKVGQGGGGTGHVVVPHPCVLGGDTDAVLAALDGVWHFGQSLARRSKNPSFSLQQRRGNRIR